MFASENVSLSPYKTESSLPNLRLEGWTDAMK